MTGRRWDDDDVLLNDLARALAEVEPVARSLARRAQAAFSWRTVDTDLQFAALSFDSSMQAQDALRTLSRPSRLLVFSAAPLSVEIEVLPEQVVGQVVPPGVADIVVESEAGDTIQVQSDERGLFLVAPLPAGPMRLRCETPTARLVTDWVQL